MWPRSEILALIFAVVLWTIISVLCLGVALLGLAVVMFLGYEAFYVMIFAMAVSCYCLPLVVKSSFWAVLLQVLASLVFLVLALAWLAQNKGDWSGLINIQILFPITVIIIYYAIRTRARVELERQLAFNKKFMLSGDGS